jgi:hypothetical protein
VPPSTVGDPDQVVPFVLYTVHCTSVHSHSHNSSYQRGSGFVSFCSVHSIGYNLALLAEISFRDLQLFVFCWKLAVATTALNCNTYVFLLHHFLCAVFSFLHSFSCCTRFTIIDRTSKWIEAVPLSDTSAAACTRA